MLVADRLLVPSVDLALLRTVPATLGVAILLSGWSGEQVWTAGCADGFQPGFGDGGVAGFDPETLELVGTIASSCGGKGVSVDGEGFLWCAGGSVAARIDLDDMTETTYNGLNGAYTYSDMTGFGVANAVGCQPAG